MKNRTIQLKEAVEPLANYVRKIRGGAIVVMSKGRPIAAVISLKKADAETISLSQNPKFLSIIQRSRARQARDGGFSSSEMRRRLLKQL